tara:strand:- start:850 stop:1671 length:822 start_codon:yes stop_codon:yes gene_type:complete
MTKKSIEYFGYLKGEKLIEITPEEKLALFIKKKLSVVTKMLELSSNTNINLFDKSNYKTIHEPSKGLIEAYFNFLLQTFKEPINSVLIDFFYLYNNQIIGLKKKESKKIGRLLFLNIINNAHSPNFDIVHMLENVNGIPKIENTPKIELYHIKRDTLKSRVIKVFPKGLDEFLLGNSKFFTYDLTQEIPIIKELIQFEGELKILLALNDEYQFEKHHPIEPLNEENTIESFSTPTLKKVSLTSKMPTEEEMDAYLMKHVFSKKNKKIVKKRGE